MRSRLIGLLAGGLAAVAGAAHAAGAPARYDLPSMPLERALLDTAMRSGLQVVYAPEAVEGRKSRPLAGEFQVDEALARLLPPDLRAVVSGGVIVVMREPAPAPEPPPPAPEPEPRPAAAPLEELVVTALKHDTLLQDTPMAITVISGESLSSVGARSLADYFRQSPGLQLVNNGTTLQRVVIRGVQSPGEATTGVYYDETPVTGPAGSQADAGASQPDINLFDIQRVEVLRGPEGTLYGAGSMGGTLRIIFNKPDLDQAAGRVESQVETVAGGGEGYGARGMVNLPLVPGRLAARVVAYRDVTGGYIDNVRYGRDDINSWGAWGARGMLAYGDEATEVQATLIHQRQEADDSIGYWLPSLGRYKTDSHVVGVYHDAFSLQNLKVVRELEGAVLTATASHYTWRIHTASDYTSILRQSAADPALCPAWFGAREPCSPDQTAAFAAYAESRLPGAWDQSASLRAWNQEVRIRSDGAGPLAWTVGAFFEDRFDRFDSRVYRVDPANGRILDVPGDVTGDRLIETQVRQHAGFGELSWRLSPALTATAGVRYYDYSKTVGGEVRTPNFLTGSTPTPFAETVGRARDWVSRVNLAYRPTDWAMLYATRAGGFRPGGANNVPGAGTTVPATYNPDGLISHEVGAKTSWLAGRVTVDAAAYRIDWRDMQVRATSSNGAWIFNTNAGAARVDGFEVEVNARPASGLTVRGSLAFVDARLVEDQTSAGANVTQATGRRGDRLPFVPRWSGAASAIYEWPIAAGVQGAVRLDYTYTGSAGSEFRPTAETYQKQPAYGLVGGRLSAQFGDLGLHLYGSNLLNAKAPARVTANLAGRRGQTVSAPPATVGLQVTRSF